jgi:hypothetical protein
VTRQNRVLPTGEIVADPARGTFMGNRGILHDAEGHKAWISCVLQFKGRRRQVMSPSRYTELFFLDEAVALAAGHRPCAECRRADYSAFQAAWQTAHGERLSAPEMDTRLHATRVESRTRRQVTHQAKADTLPDGTFLMWQGRPHLLLGGLVYPYRAEGYDEFLPRPSGMVEVLTPRPLVAVLAAGYKPALHESIRPAPRPS